VGTIVTRLAHAIVHPSTPQITFAGADGTAIRRQCGGDAFERSVHEALDAQLLSRLDTGDCLVTDAGTASGFRWVLHVPAVDPHLEDPETGGVSGPTRVCDCTFAFLDHAAELAKREGLAGDLVVASGLLAVEDRGVSALVSARAMAAALRDFLRSSQASSLHSIVLVSASEGDAAMVREAIAV
jgi:O-acetyl-ADP-ribose deacetylase (regulator of RNase III)